MAASKTVDRFRLKLREHDESWNRVWGVGGGGAIIVSL